MAEKIGDLAYLVVDCLDNERAATFWGRVLGLEITSRSPPYIDLARSADGAPVMSFQKVGDVETDKNRVHPDIKVPNLEVATERIIAIGGALVQTCVEGPYSWRVMADTEGNKFCIVLD